MSPVAEALSNCLPSLSLTFPMKRPSGLYGRARTCLEGITKQRQEVENNSEYGCRLCNSVTPSTGVCVQRDRGD